MPQDGHTNLKKSCRICCKVFKMCVAMLRNYSLKNALMPLIIRIQLTKSTCLKQNMLKIIKSKQAAKLFLKVLSKMQFFEGTITLKYTLLITDATNVTELHFQCRIINICITRLLLEVVVRRYSIK